jgi:SOS-response transcriptional repressor LexA
MLPPLTTRQSEVLEFVRQFLAKAGYPPTVREIGAHFGFVPRSVFDHLKALERKGYLRRIASKSRSLQILDPAPPSLPGSQLATRGSRLAARGSQIMPRGRPRPTLRSPLSALGSQLSALISGCPPSRNPPP